jgi:uncharacterized protein (TIGR02246 family)
MEAWELEAREAIRDLVARYNANGDTRRFDQVIELFAPDAVMEIADRVPLVGTEAIRSLFTAVANRPSEDDRPTYVRHMTATLQIDLIDKSTAKGRCYFFVLTDVGLDHWGRYVDDYRTVEGLWKFARRRVTTDGHSPNSKFQPSE